MLSVRLLGVVAAERTGEPVALTAPVARLLALLALNPGPHPRDMVAEELWPLAEPALARANLRTAVWTLRKAVGDEVLLATRTTVGLCAEQVRVDVADVVQRAVEGDPVAVDALARAELLAGIRDEWAETARRAHRRVVLDALTGLARRAERDGNPAGAAAWTRRRCELDPLDEAAAADLLHHLVAAGDRASAVQAGRTIVARLRDQLRVSPGAALRAALAEVRGPARPGLVAGPVRTPLFGRTAELRTLAGEWTASRAGAGRVVIVTGEAGIGKSRLVGELARRADNAGARVALGAGVDVGGEAPLAMWQELVPQLARTVPPPQGSAWPGELSRLVPEVAGLLGYATPPAPIASPELERLRIFDGVLRLVEWAASGRPVLLVTEDVHRADRASMQLCAHIGRRLRNLPVLFVLTRRDRPERSEPDELIADLSARGVPVTQLDLGPLAANEVAAVARSIADLPEQAVDQVVRAADGNPLLAVASARAHAAGGEAAPAGLRPIVRAALGQLSRPARDLAETLAVAGRELTSGELDALRIPDPDDAQEAVLNTGLVQRLGGGLRFRHALLAEAVRAELGETGRRYERLALAIETAADAPDRVAAEVARLLQRAGRADQAGSRWRRAARLARALGALPEAAQFWVEAAHCDPHDAEPHLELAEVYGWMGRPDEFEREWQTALELLPPDRQSVAWARRGGVLRTVVCNPTASVAAYQRAAELLAPDAPLVVREEIMLGTAWGEASAGDPDRAAQLLDEVERLAVQPDDGLRAEIANARLMTLIRLGRFAECRAVAEAGGAAAQQAGRPNLGYPIWLHTACALSCTGDLAGALAAADQGIAITRGVPVIELPCLAGRAFILSRLGRHDEAGDAAARQLELAERIDAPEFAAVARHDAGLVALAAGRYAAAAALLGAALADNAKVNRPATHLARAEALARCGQAEAAAAELRAAALEPVRSADQPWALVPRMARVQALIALARGDRNEARRRLDEAAAGWQRRLPHDIGAEFMATFIDLGRPPIVGLVEPDRELRHVLAERVALDEPAEVS